MALCFRRSRTHKEILVLNIADIEKKENCSHKPAVSTAPLQPGTNRSLLWTIASALQTWSWLLQTLPSQPDQMHLKAEAGGSLEFIIPEPSHSPAPQHQGQNTTSHLSHLVDNFGFYKCCYYLLIKRDFFTIPGSKIQ